MSGKWALQALPDTIEVIDLPTVHGFFVVIPKQARVFHSKSPLAYALNLHNRVEVRDGPILMARDKVRLLGIERHLPVPQEGLGTTTPGTLGRRGGKPLMQAVDAVPLAPEPAHVPQTALPLVMDRVALVEDVLQDMPVVLLWVSLLGPCQPVVRLPGAPVRMSHLTWVEDVLTTVRRLVDTIDEVLLDVAKQQRRALVDLR